MSSENKFDEIDETKNDSNSDEETSSLLNLPEETEETEQEQKDNIAKSIDFTDDTYTEYKSTAEYKSQKRKRMAICPTLIVATCIFAVTILFFMGWKFFFDDSITGTWGIDIQYETQDSETSENKTQTVNYTLTFKDDDVIEFHHDGTTLTGKYYFTDSEGQNPQLLITIYNVGNPYITAYFDYSFEGNVFTGRRLNLVDRSGLFLSSDTVSENGKTDETVKKKMQITDSVVIDSTRYYIWSFKPSQTEFKIEKYDDFKSDDKLLGSWLLKDASEGYDYTYTFYDDGTFQIMSTEVDTRGAYKIEDGKCTIHYFEINGTEYETPIEYSVNGDKLKFSGTELTKTASKYDYKPEVK